jgi:hypothetical protein
MRLINQNDDRDDDELLTPQEADSIEILGNCIYSHQRLQVNYTTYDLRRDQDSINPRSHADIMVLSQEDDTGEANWHPYWYSRIIGIFHAHVYFRGLASYPDIKPGHHTMHFLFVRWFGIETNHRYGWRAKHLPMLSFTGTDDPDAFGFLNPQYVIRAVHLIPAFNFGHTDTLLPPSIARLPSEKDEDYLFYYVNM